VDKSGDADLRGNFFGPGRKIRAAVTLWGGRAITRLTEGARQGAKNAADCERRIFAFTRFSGRS
jgi:hypothetical protein